MNLDQFLRRLGPIALRFFMAGVFFWFGFTQLMNSQAWVSYLPEFVTKWLVDPTWFIFLNGSMEIVLATFLVFGFYIRLSAFVLGAHLLGIAWTIGLNTSTGVRDIGLGFASLTIFLYGHDGFSVDEYLIRKKEMGEKLFILMTHVLFGTIAVVLLALTYHIYTTHKLPIPSLTQIDVNEVVTPGPTDKTPAPKTGIGLSAQTVAAHSSITDCWIIINSKVYNVTQYIPFHPGGQDKITKQCGKESTKAFTTKDGAGTHSATALKLLGTFYIGDIGQTIGSNQATPTPTPTPNPTPAPNPVPVPTPTPAPAPTPPSTASYTAAQVATHNTASDCWLIISGKVYNVTQYIPFHPGGQARIIDNCGTDATGPFSTKGATGGTHSATALSILAGYFVGNLSTGGTPTPTPTPTPNPASSATVSVTSTSISPSSLTIPAGTTVTFSYTGEGEAILVFSPQPPSSIKIDHDIRTKTYTFSTPGTWTYRIQDASGATANIIVQ